MATVVFISMTEPTIYNLYIDGDEHLITITPAIQRIPGGDLYLTGVYKLSEGNLSMGEIVFDDEMKQWEYTGMGDISHNEAEEIARFIQESQDPA